MWQEFATELAKPSALLGDMQTDATPGTVPVHHQIADSLRAEIAAGDLGPGDELPTLKQLRERWACADGPARRALDVLRSEGLITAGRGRPATVRIPPARTPVTLSASWTQEQNNLVLRSRAERMKQGAIELTAGISIDETISTHRYSEVPATGDLVTEFGIQPGALLLRREYEMTNPETHHLISWSISHIPHELIKGNPELLDDANEPWPGGHQHQLYTVGIEIASFRRTVLAIQPTPAEQARWGIDTGVPIIAIRTRSVDINERVVEISDARYPADRVEINLIENLDRWPADHPTYDRAKDV